MSYETYRVRFAPDLSGHTAFVVLGVGGTALYYLFSEMASVIVNPGEYAWVHVVSTHFYYYTAFLPLKGILGAWEFGSRLTPWHNLNFILAILAVPIYLVVAIFALGIPWYAVTRRFCRINPVFAYSLPALASGIWAAGQWLFS